MTNIFEKEIELWLTVHYVAELRTKCFCQPFQMIKDIKRRKWNLIVNYCGFGKKLITSK